jgi:hypothetical protein
VNDEFFHWLRATYASDGIGDIKASHGAWHEYLGMALDFTSKGKLKVDMKVYVNSMVKEFQEK